MKVTSNRLTGTIPTQASTITVDPSPKRDRRKLSIEACLRKPNPQSNPTMNKAEVLSRISRRHCMSSAILYSQFPSFHFHMTQYGHWTNMQTQLYLDSNSLTGACPTQLGAMTGISSYFRLRTNFLSQALPSELGRLSVLTTGFSVDGAGFEGRLPTQLGQLTKLASYLSLSSNKFSGPLPTEVCFGIY